MNHAIDWSKKTALVCSGGVVKAACWHIGVTKALEELGFHFHTYNHRPQSSPVIDTYVSSSAGSLIALYLAAGYEPRQIIDSQIKNQPSPVPPIRYKDILSIERPLKTPKNYWQGIKEFPYVLRSMLKPLSRIDGFFTTYGLNKYLSHKVLPQKNFEDYSCDLFIVATQLDNSRKVIFSKYNYPCPMHDNTAHYYTGVSIADAACASMSVPPFYAPYPILNPMTNKIDYYIDGEIRETLSSHAAIDNGCKNLICSWTHTPYHFHEEIGSLIHYGLPAICVQSLFLLIQRKIISSRSKAFAVKDVVQTISDYMKDENFSEKHRKKIIKIIEQKLGFSIDINFIDIYPDHHNTDMFFLSHFSLNNEITSQVVKMGYKKTMSVFSQWS